MNLQHAQQIVGKPMVGPTNIGPNWERPKDLTKEQHQLLDNMHFPKEVKNPDVLKKRIPQTKTGTVYLKPTTIEGFSEIKYSVCRHAVAMIQDKALQLSRATKPQQIEVFVSNYQKSDHVSQYMGREHIEAEMRWVLKTLGHLVVPDEIKIASAGNSGAPDQTEDTPEGQLAQSDQPDEQDPPADDQGLTAQDKRAITNGKKKGDSAEDIADQIDKPIELVIAYMAKK